MTGDDPSTDTDADASTVDPRTRRARNEDMSVALRRAGGIYSVRSESGNTYRVDIALPECSCPDQQQRGVERCKHIRRVDMEIRNRSVPTPDGRLPERPVVDGGIGSDRGDASRADDGTRIEGPIREFDRDDRPTGFPYYRCGVCGRASMRRQDLETCCPVAQR